MSLTPEQIDDLRAEFLDLTARASALTERCNEIKATLRANLTVGSHADGGVRINHPHKFSPDKAREILPPELLALVEVEVPAHTEVDPKQAKNLLAPALYKACTVPAGEPRVTIA